LAGHTEFTCHHHRIIRISAHGGISTPSVIQPVATLRSILNPSFHVATTYLTLSFRGPLISPSGSKLPHYVEDMYLYHMHTSKLDVIRHRRYAKDKIKIIRYGSQKWGIPHRLQKTTKVASRHLFDEGKAWRCSVLVTLGTVVQAK
jgi:hypothetical protein